MLRVGSTVVPTLGSRVALRVEKMKCPIFKWEKENALSSR